ncbi:ABC transporter substrate-binding protein [Sinorhizobium meliloti]|uniref:ABC transporter substrate-binding protein n=1 Tax=Rhizobium meliloti TaxID=382 RepID=UPI001F331B10|nr:ABC transporter substrate-binding protein [Sinorhizobium meliloti]
MPANVGRSRGLEHKFLFATTRHEPVYLAVPIDSDIKSIDDVKGKKVALFKRTNLQLATGRVLSTHGLTEKDVRFINLRHKRCRSDPHLRQCRRRVWRSGIPGAGEERDREDRLHHQGRRSDTRPPHVLSVTAAFEQAHPDVTQRVVTTFIKAAAFASDPANKDEVFDAWSLSGFPKDAFEGDVERETLANRLNPLIDDFIIARYKDQVARAKAYGVDQGRRRR